MLSSILGTVTPTLFTVIPAKAGIQLEFAISEPSQSWAPAFAGVTEKSRKR